jgi:hypothetical protein
MKHIKLFEPFLNEELSPELRQRAMNKGYELAKDTNRIDSVLKGRQADKIHYHVSAPVKDLEKKLEEMTKEILNKDDKGNKLVGGAKVTIYDRAMSNVKNGIPGCEIEVSHIYPGVIGISNPEKRVCLYIKVKKDGYTKEKLDPTNGKNDTNGGYKLLQNKDFVKTLEKLIKEIQINEIPNQEGSK